MPLPLPPQRQQQRHRNCVCVSVCICFHCATRVAGARWHHRSALPPQTTPPCARPPTHSQCQHPPPLTNLQTTNVSTLEAQVASLQERALRLAATEGGAAGEVQAVRGCADRISAKLAAVHSALEGLRKDSAAASAAGARLRSAAVIVSSCTLGVFPVPAPSVVCCRTPQPPPPRHLQTAARRVMRLCWRSPPPWSAWRWRTVRCARRRTPPANA